ncbi:hypothetical protein V6Z11_D08G206200 [Gossypium hirsutum]
MAKPKKRKKGRQRREETYKRFFFIFLVNIRVIKIVFEVVEEIGIGELVVGSDDAFTEDLRCVNTVDFRKSRIPSASASSSLLFFRLLGISLVDLILIISVEISFPPHLSTLFFTIDYGFCGATKKLNFCKNKNKNKKF